MGKFTGKGNHTVKVGNQSHTNTKTSNGEESTHAFEIMYFGLGAICFTLGEAF